MISENSIHDDATIRVTGALVIPSRVAVILAVPPAKQVAKPVDEILTALISSLDQITCELISAVEPSE
jgi:hypothetical protein